MTSVILVCGAAPVVSHCLPPLILHNSSLTGVTDAERRNSQYKHYIVLFMAGNSNLNVQTWCWTSASSFKMTERLKSLTARWKQFHRGFTIVLEKDDEDEDVLVTFLFLGAFDTTCVIPHTCRPQTLRFQTAATFLHLHKRPLIKLTDPVFCPTALFWLVPQ